MAWGGTFLKTSTSDTMRKPLFTVCDVAAEEHKKKGVYVRITAEDVDKKRYGQFFFITKADGSPKTAKQKQHMIEQMSFYGLDLFKEGVWDKITNQEKAIRLTALPSTNIDVTAYYRTRTESKGRFMFRDIVYVKPEGKKGIRKFTPARTNDLDLFKI